MEAQLFLGPISLKQTHLTSSDIVADVLVFGDVASMIDIMWLHKVPLNF